MKIKRIQTFTKCPPGPPVGAQQIVHRRGFHLERV